MDSKPSAHQNPTNIDSAVALVDMNSYRTVGLNDNFAAVLGLKYEQLLGQNLPVLGVWENPKTIKEFMRMLRAKRVLKGCHTKIRSGEGRPRPIQISGEILLVNGKPFSIITLRNITRNVIRPIQTLHSGNELWSTLNCIRDAITVHDKNFNVLFANKAAEILLHRPIEEIIGQKCYKLYHGCECPPENCLSCNVLYGGKSPVIEISEPFLQRTIEVEATRYYNESNEISGLIHVVRDVTQRQQLLNRLRCIGSLVEQADEAIAEINLEGNIIYANPAFALIYGYDPEHVAGRNISAFYSSQPEQNNFLEDPELFNNGKSFCELSHFRKDGSSFNATVEKSLVRNEASEVVGIRIVVKKRNLKNIDIHSVDSIQESYHHLLDSSYDWEHWLKPDGSTGYVSPSVKRVTGYRDSEFVSNTRLMEEIIADEDRDIWLQHRQDVSRSHEFQRIQFRIIRKDGKIRWIEHACCPINGSDNTYLGTHATNRDISEIKKQEESILQNMDNWHRLFDEAGALIIYCRQDGVINALNRNAAGRLGGNPDDFVGKCIYDLIASQYANNLRNSINHVISMKEPYEYEEIVSVSDRSRKFFVSKVFPLKNENGQVDSVQIISHEITAIKKAEKKLRAYQRNLEELLEVRTKEWTEANVRLMREIAERLHLENETLRISEKEQRRMGRELHDNLGQRLTGVSFLIESLIKKSEGLPDDYTSVIREISEQVSKTISDIRLLSTGLYPVDLDNGNLVEAIKHLASTTEHIYGVPCVFKCEDPVFAEQSDTLTHLYYIAKEAVSNAIKHGCATKIQITLVFNRKQSVLTIRNDGKQFNKDKDIQKYEGLGLQIMARRSDLIGASLEICPLDEGGTLVTCRIPNRKS